MPLKALNKHRKPSDVAGYIRKDFDRKFGGDWNCIVIDRFVQQFLFLSYICLILNLIEKRPVILAFRLGGIAVRKFSRSKWCKWASSPIFHRDIIGK